MWRDLKSRHIAAGGHRHSRPAVTRSSARRSAATAAIRAFDGVQGRWRRWARSLAPTSSQRSNDEGSGGVMLFRRGSWESLRTLVNGRTALRVGAPLGDAATWRRWRSSAWVRVGSKRCPTPIRDARRRSWRSNRATRWRSGRLSPSDFADLPRRSPSLRGPLRPNSTRCRHFITAAAEGQRRAGDLRPGRRGAPARHGATHRRAIRSRRTP